MGFFHRWLTSWALRHRPSPIPITQCEQIDEIVTSGFLCYAGGSSLFRSLVCPAKHMCKGLAQMPKVRSDSTKPLADGVCGMMYDDGLESHPSLSLSHMSAIDFVY